MYIYIHIHTHTHTICIPIHTHTLSTTYHPPRRSLERDAYSGDICCWKQHFQLNILHFQLNILKALGTNILKSSQRKNYFCTLGPIIPFHLLKPQFPQVLPVSTILPTVIFFLPVQLLFWGKFQVKVVNLTSCFPFPSILSGVGNSNADCFGPEIHLRAHCIAFNQIFTVINLSWMAL